ncbi:hypothetical protein DFH09DRAFT_1440778 [Mycena vulgaris]|nr:hypothetical protein DFH09DRAFT_1440778 [Mycena vulgaris]
MLIPEVEEWRRRALLDSSLVAHLLGGAHGSPMNGTDLEARQSCGTSGSFCTSVASSSAPRLLRHAGPDKGPGPRAPVCPAARLAERSVDLTTTSAGSAPGQANRAVISPATLEPAASPAFIEFPSPSAIKVEGLLFGVHVSQGFTDAVRGQTSFRPRESFEHRPIKEPVVKQFQSMHCPEIEELDWIGGGYEVLQTQSLAPDRLNG